MQKKNERSGSFKFKVAIEALKGNKTTAEICQEYTAPLEVEHQAANF